MLVRRIDWRTRIMRIGRERVRMRMRGAGMRLNAMHDWSRTMSGMRMVRMVLMVVLVVMRVMTIVTLAWLYTGIHSDGTLFSHRYNLCDWSND